MFIRAIGTALPKKRVTLGRDFLSKKKHFENESKASFYKAGRNDTPLTLALKAAKAALKNARASAGTIDAVIYGESSLKDHQGWSMASAICNGLGLHDRMFLDIYQGCNAMSAAIELAVNLLRADKRFNNILVATSSVIPPRIGDHRTIDSGDIMSDGASAVIVSRKNGIFRILSIELMYRSQLNDMIKFPFGGYLHIRDKRCYEKWSLEKCKNDFWKRNKFKADMFIECKKMNATRALKAAGIGRDKIDLVISHNYCRAFNSTIDGMFDVPRDHISTDIGMEVSHAGASDIIINLEKMSHMIKKGDTCLVHQDGAGFSFSSMVIRKIR